MPTQAIKELLPRTIEPPSFKDFLDEISNTLEEIVNYGTHVFSWVTNDKDKIKNDLDVPLILLLKYSLELIDAISILARQMSVDSCKSLLRILLEVMFYISYLTEKDAELRSKCYLVCHFNERLNSMKNFIPGTQQHEQFISKIRKDRNMQSSATIFNSITEGMASNKIKNLEELLSSVVYREVIREYDRYKKQNKQKPKWYALYNNKVNNIEGLADYLNYQSLYNVVYRDWSNLTHASDVITGHLAPSDSRFGAFYQIRMGRDVNQVAVFAITLANLIYHSVIKYYAPEREVEYFEWYRTEIMPKRKKIESTKVVVT